MDSCRESRLDRRGSERRRDPNAASSDRSPPASSPPVERIRSEDDADEGSRSPRNLETLEVRLDLQIEEESTSRCPHRDVPSTLQPIRTRDWRRRIDSRCVAKINTTSMGTCRKCNVRRCSHPPRRPAKSLARSGKYCGRARPHEVVGHFSCVTCRCSRRGSVSPLSSQSKSQLCCNDRRSRTVLGNTRGCGRVRAKSVQLSGKA